MAQFGAAETPLMPMRSASSRGPIVVWCPSLDDFSEDPVVGLYPREVWPQLNSQWMALACTPILASASDALVVKGPPEELNDESIDVVNLTF